MGEAGSVCASTGAFVMACQLAHLLLIWAAATSATPLPRTNQTATPLPRTNQTATPPPAWSDVSVQTTFGWLHGRLFERRAEFLGVPYATNERFEPAADWSESFTPFLGRQATKAAPACPQAPGILPADDPTDEHCLFLNIFVPRSVVEAAKEGAPADTPIMLFFPGGAFIAGSASEGFDRDGWSGLGPYGVNLGYNASLMVADSGVIVVTANYRLGVLGFGAMPEDAAAGSSTGNFGLLDQRSSMRYVAAHIAAFGGDNKRVTIYGESAGAISVALHYVMPNSYNSGLFHGALSESGFTGAQNLQVALNRTRRVAQLLGCPVDSPKSCLKKADLGALVRAQKTVMPGDPLSGGGLEAWFPVIDGVEIIQEPFRSVYEGKFNRDIALLLGSNTDEGSLFVEMGHIFGVWGDRAFNTLANQTVNAATGIHHMNNSMLERARELYHPSSFWDNSARNAQLLTDYTFACGSRSLAQQVSQ